MYLNYNEYQEMGGTLNETAFNVYAFEANQKIKTATFDRITEPSEAVKKCMMRLIALSQESDVCVQHVASFSHDGLSQSFTATEPAVYVKQARMIIRDYLINEKATDGTPLLYCGVSSYD